MVKGVLFVATVCYLYNLVHKYYRV